MNMSISFPGLELSFDHVPQLFKVLGYEITINGLLLALSMVLGLFLLIVESKRAHINPNLILGAATFGILGAVIGARAFYVLFTWNYYNGDIEKILNIRDGGFAFYGALFGGIVLVSLFCLFAKLSFMKAADIMCPSILLVQIAGRIGDFFNRSSFGEYTDHALAMQLPVSSVRMEDVTEKMMEHMISIDGESFVLVHPLFLYEAIWCLGMFLILVAVQRSKKYTGEVFMRYLMAYGLGRCIIEYFRTDSLLIPGTKISVSMLISGVLFVLFFIVSTAKRTMASKRAARKRRRYEEKINE